MNNWNAIGRVGQNDAVIRHTKEGKPVTGWSLAVDNGWGDNKQTIWVDCSWWGERSVKVAPYITKGSQIGVTGELGTREHDGKTYITLRIADVTLTGSKDSGQASAPRSQPQRSEPAQQPAAAAGDHDPFSDDIPI